MDARSCAREMSGTATSGYPKTSQPPCTADQLRSSSWEHPTALNTSGMWLSSLEMIL